MTAARSFKLGAKSVVGDEDAAYEPIEYEFEEAPLINADGKPEKPVTRTIFAHWPGEGPMTLLLASTGADSGASDSIAATFAFLEAAFSPADYKYVRAAVRKGELEVIDLVDMMRDMVGAWTTFPTKPSSGSAVSQRPTGTRSTGRARPAV